MYVRAVWVMLLLVATASAQDEPSPDDVLAGLRSFYAKTARVDGSFQNGLDPDYQGISDSAYSDMAAVTYAVTIHKTFGWKLPHEEKTIEWLLSRQEESGDFVNKAGTVDPKSPQGRVYNTTQALVALHALGVQPKHDPLPVFEEILKQDYKTLPAYSTSFFPLAYLCAGKPIPEQADRAIRALMVPDREGYLNDHVAATFHSSHYYALVGEPTPRGHLMVPRILRDQAADGSWLINPFARDRHATFDAVFTLRHEANDDRKANKAIKRAAQWALSCRNDDGGFGHYPGSTSDADANYFQIGTLVMAGYLKPVEPLPKDPHLLSWGHLLPLREEANPRRFTFDAWVGALAFDADNETLAVGASDGRLALMNVTASWIGRSARHRGPVTALAYTSDGRLLLSGGFDHEGMLGPTPYTTMSLKGHRGAVTSVAISSDDEWLATASIDGTIRLWDAKTGEHRRTFTGHKSWVNAVAFPPDAENEVLYSGSSDGTVKMWNLATGEALRTLSVTNAEVRSIAISPNGKILAAGVRYGVVKLISLENFGEIGTLKQPADDVWSLVFSPDGSRLYVAAGEWNRPTEIGVWDVASQKQVDRLRHTGEVLAMALSRDGKWLAAGGGDSAVSVWRIDE